MPKRPKSPVDQLNEAVEALAADATPRGIADALDPSRIVTEDDGESDLYTQGAPLPMPASAGLGLLDAVAIQLFVKGWPHDDIYHRAGMFLRIRAAHLAGEVFKPQVEPVRKGMAKR